MDELKLLRRISSGRVHNVKFDDLVKLSQKLGFRLSRIQGSHHLFDHDLIPDTLNLQPDRGQAKEYQIRQLLKLIQEYGLEVRDD